jgi:hypothetical protein
LKEERLQEDATIVAKKFARDPTTVTMEALFQNTHHKLFTVIPSDDRSVYTSRVTTSHLRGLVVDAIADLDTGNHVSFYCRANRLLEFQGTLRYVFKEHFLVWLYSTEWDNTVSCTPKSTSPVRSVEPPKHKKRKLSKVAADDQAELRLQPLGPEKVTVIYGDSDFKDVKDCDTPFGLVLESQMFRTFDAVICTDKRVITIQVTVSPKHTLKRDGFERLKKHLPKKFQRTQMWCHVFLTDSHENASSLRNQHRQVAKDMNIAIYSAVLDVSASNFSFEDLECTFTP